MKRRISVYEEFTEKVSWFESNSDTDTNPEIKKDREKAKKLTDRKILLAKSIYKLNDELKKISRLNNEANILREDEVTNFFNMFSFTIEREKNGIPDFISVGKNDILHMIRTAFINRKRDSSVEIFSFLLEVGALERDETTYVKSGRTFYKPRYSYLINLRERNIMIREEYDKLLKKGEEQKHQIEREIEDIELRKKRIKDRIKITNEKNKERRALTKTAPSPPDPVALNTSDTNTYTYSNHSTTSTYNIKPA